MPGREALCGTALLRVSTVESAIEIRTLQDIVTFSCIYRSGTRNTPPPPLVRDTRRSIARPDTSTLFPNPVVPTPSASTERRASTTTRPGRTVALSETSSDQ